MSGRWTRRAVLALVVAGGLLASAPAWAAPTKEVVILTSFPKELFEAYKQAFEQRTPWVKVIVKQQQTNAAVTYLRETRAKPDVDVFWVSAVDAFQTLKTDGLLDRPPIGKDLLCPSSRRVSWPPPCPSTPGAPPTRTSTRPSRARPT